MLSGDNTRVSGSGVTWLSFLTALAFSISGCTGDSPSPSLSSGSLSPGSPPSPSAEKIAQQEIQAATAELNTTETYALTREDVELLNDEALLSDEERSDLMAMAKDEEDESN